MVDSEAPLEPLHSSEDGDGDVSCDTAQETESFLLHRVTKLGLVVAVAALALAGAALAVHSRWGYKTRGALVRTFAFGEKAQVCTEEPMEGVPHCCANGPETIYSVKREYENVNLCGHVQCSTGRFIGDECTNRETSIDALDQLNTIILKRANSRKRAKEEKLMKREARRARRLQAAKAMVDPANARRLSDPEVVMFPSPETMTADEQLVAKGMVPPDADADAEKRQKQQDQAYCSGSISAATIFTAGVGLEIAGAVFYCAKYVTSVQPEKCSRQIFAVVEDMAITAKYSLEAAADCSHKDEDCGIAVDDMLSRTFDMGVAASRMEADCNRFVYAPGTVNHFSCGGDLQKLSENFPDWMGDITEGMRTCHEPKEEGFLQDYGLCTGSVLSVTGIIAAAALQFEYIPRSCGDPKTDKENGPQCSTTVAASLQSLTVGASTAVDAVSNCGGLDTDCGVDLSDLASSIFDIQTAFSNVATFCTPDDFFRQYDTVTELTNMVSADCADSITNGIQGLSVLSATALDAANSCAPGNDNEHNNECGSGVSKALGSFSFLAGQITEAYMNCRHGPLEYYGFYKCAANFERIADIADTTSESIGDAVAQCGLQEAHEATQEAVSLAPVQLPRRYYRNVR